ncbi:hypothetical protein EGI31_14030 [Lacihabitans soyangensis]|uniref:Uncharacterized protein n=2 Tax=Lacihabitans soyangensis TaxID=869394 RepID=A0AAE3H6U5_9BACT|nr:hypothetical protein [Lacihabitans soyangensis]
MVAAKFEFYSKNDYLFFQNHQKKNSFSMIKRDCSALLFNNDLYLIVQKGTESLSIPTEKFYKLSILDNSKYIGSLVKETLYSYIPDRTRLGREDWKKADDTLLKAVEFKTVKKLFDSVKIVNIFSRDNKLILLPYKNSGYNKSGSKSIDDKMITTDLESVTDFELGEMLKQAFEIATLEV